MTDTTNADMTKAGVRESINGKANKAKGSIEDAAGGLTGNAKLQVKGKMDKAKGVIEDEVGKALRSPNTKI